MKKMNSFFRSNPKLLPPLLVVGALLFEVFVAYSFSPHSPLVSRQQETNGKAVSYAVKPTEAAVPTLHVTVSPSRGVLGLQTRTSKPQPNVSKAVTVKETTTSQNNATGGTTISNNAVQQPTIAQSAPTQAQSTQTVSVELKSPDGASTFSVDHNEGMNVCDVLQKAKDAGKLKSVTLDDSYMTTLHSKYVSEINGFADNWTFSVNGNSPLGCSLYQPKPNDTIVWKFG